MSIPAKNRPGGVLPINAAVTRKTAPSQKPVQRPPAPKLRLIIRRLPPGLTEVELCNALGEEWLTGKGKVDWFAFKPGKISKDPSKPSRPARAYLKVKHQSLLEHLSVKVRQTQFKDAKNTTSDPCLLGPPSLEFAPYSKVPTGRVRHDGRQGTIDQDQEFIDFLQSLTEPITKSAVDGDTGDVKPEKITTTPLIQFIKEKKANKAKEKEAAAAAKSAKREKDPKESKVKGGTQSTIIVKSKDAAIEKARATKATQDTVKAINKSMASMSKPTSAKTESKSKDAQQTNTTTQPSTPKRERERGNVSAAARMISRDLGLTPKDSRTPKMQRNTENNSSNVAAATSNTPQSEPSQPQSSTPKPTTTKSTPAATTASVPTPRTKSSGTTQQTKSQTPGQKTSKAAQQPSAGAKSAFLKHANPSQGITEELLRSTFAEFGEIIRCEIDKKKGLGYVDFAEAEALRKAMAEGPVKVANGQVQVLENRSPQNKKPTKQTSKEPQTPRIASPATSAVNSPRPLAASIASSTADPLSSAGPESDGIDATAAGSAAQKQNQQNPEQPSARGSKGGRGGRGGQNNNSGRGGGAGRGNKGNFRGRGRGAKTASTTVSTSSAVDSANTTTDAASSGNSTVPTSASKTESG